MKTYIKLILLLFIVLCHSGIKAQNITWNSDGSVTVEGSYTFKLTPSSAHYMNIHTQSIFSLSHRELSDGGLLVNGISSPVHYDSPLPELPTSDGAVMKVEFYYYDDDTPGPLIYGVFATENDDSNFQHGYWNITNNWTLKNSTSKDIKRNILKETSQSYFSDFFEDYDQDLIQRGLGSSSIPIYISISVTNATLKKIKIPGRGTFTPTELFQHHVQEVVINVYDPTGATLKNTYTYEGGSSASTTTVNARLGDKIEIVVTDSDSSSLPEISNLPATWLAATGREYYYHCDPSITPGSIKPKVSFDVQSHYVSSNEAPVEYYPDWVQDPSNPNVHTLTWYAQRQTDPDKTNYQAQYKFKKADVLGTKMQRKSKSEGQVMDFLNIYNANKYSSDIGYRYNATNRKFYWNVDSDELLYFNTKDYNTNTQGWDGHVKRVPLYDLEVANDPYSAASIASPGEVESSIASLYEPWQLIREGDYTWGTDGYPLSGFVINDLVDAYREYYDLNEEGYRGYEIEDFCLYKDSNDNCYSATGENPAEIGSGVVYHNDSNVLNDNNKHPGNLLITVGGSTINIPIQVDSPMGTDHGFYGHIITPSYSNVKSDITLKIVGLPKNLSTTKMAWFTIETRSYSLQDFPVATYQLGTDGNYNSELGTWEIPMTTDYNQGQCATLFYSGNPNDETTKVIISGSEWKNTTIPYIFSTTEDCSDCLDLKTGYEDFVDNYVQKKRYEYDYSRGYINNYDGHTYWPNYLRHYVLSVDDKDIQLSCMDALDNIWDMDGKAYYWGYRALAKQITDQTLSNHLIYKLTDLSTGNTTSHPGRTFKFSPATYGVGDYELQVYSTGTNSGNPSTKVKIKVVDFDETDEGPEKANIYTRKLYASEIDYLGLADDTNLPNYRVATINDVLAKYLYVDGPRAQKHDGTKNRFAKHNDFRDEFVWKDLTNSPISNIPTVQTQVDAFDPTAYWNPEWKDWLRHFSYGHFPKTYVTADDNQIFDSDIRSYIINMFQDNDYKLADYLRGLIWLAPTDYDGYRINGLMKTIVDLETFFNDYAFSGAANPVKTDMLPAFVNQNQDLPDDTKNKLWLFRKLQTGGMIIYDTTTDISGLKVYNTDGTTDTFMAQTNHTEPIPLMIGQDLVTIQDYGSETDNDGSQSFPIPAGVTTYLNLYTLRTNNADEALNAQGCPTKLVDLYGGLGEDLNGNFVETYYNKGGGPLNTRQLADTYPNSDLNIGLLFTTIATTCDASGLADMTTIKNGDYDAEIDRLITFCQSRTDQTIYLRPGYEFDLVWNIGYQDTNEYKLAYRYIVQRMKNAGVSNVKYVWQASVSPFNYVDYLAYQAGELNELLDGRIPHNPWNLEDWYPGDDYVDVIGLSWFENPDSKGGIAISKYGASNVKTQRELSDELLAIARRKNKPVMIAEATPRGYEISALTKSNTHASWDGQIYNPWDNDPTKRVKKGTIGVSAKKIWDDFYQPLFDYIEENGDVIKYFHYINADWTSDLQWQWNSEYQYWGDARVQENADIKRWWQNEINKPKWIHGNSLNGPVENSLVVSHITSTKAHLSWSMNNQPEIEVYNLFVITQGGGGTTLKKNATPNADNNHISISSLAPETTYTATLTYLDYYGNQVGSSISVDFTTLSDVGGKSAPSPKNPVETSDGTVPSPKNPIETNDGTASSPKNPIKTNDGTTFSLYPNPTSGELLIDFSLEQPSPVGIELFDLSGRLLFKESDYRDKGQHKFRFSDLRSYHNGSGVVLIKMTTGDSSIVKRVVIK